MKRLAATWKTAIWLYLIVQVVAAVVFLAGRRPSPETPVIEGVSAAGAVDAADYRHGARVRVSGYDWFRSHHPLYLIDGELRPSPLEKWASLRADAQPWLEVILPRALDLEAVDLVHAGAYENPQYTVRRYRLSCWRGQERIAQLQVTDNRLPRAHHPLPCPRSDRLRIEFDTEPGTPRDVVRLYEVDLATGPRSAP